MELRKKEDRVQRLEKLITNLKDANWLQILGSLNDKSKRNILSTIPKSSSTNN